MSDDELKELDWLRYFYAKARHGMGPADSDIYAWLKESYEEAGYVLPEEYRDEE